jgi:DNA topoisomerase-3
VLEKLFMALKDRPVTAQTLRKKSRVAKAVFEKALEKLWLHGGAQGVLEEQIVRGHERWRAAYAAQRDLRLDQLARMGAFAHGKRCRMLALIEHFGDVADSGPACGLCDACAPTASIKGQAPEPGLSFPPALQAGKRGKPSKARPSGKRRSARTPAIALPSTGPAAALVAKLRAWRLQEAKKKRVPAFRVLTNRALVAIAEARPESSSALKSVAGVGPTVLRTYSATLVSLCSR